MKRALFFVLFGSLVVALSYSFSFLKSTPSCKDIFDKTFSSIDKIQSLKFHLKCNERIKGKLSETESKVKLNKFPRKIYIYLKGPEVLWVEGQNKGNAIVNPDGFPYINLSLDPMGSLMRENQHHTIHEMGFEYFANIIKNSIEVTGDKFETYFKYGGTIKWEGRDCFLVTADYPDFKFIDYTVKQGETVVSIAKKFRVSDYMILENNQNQLKNMNEAKVNQKIKVPNVYASKVILYIDKDFFIPRVIKIYDDKGLFEAYEYHDLELNPKFEEGEFTKGYKDYKF